MAVSATPCVYFAPKSSRPWYDPATDEEPNDCVCALSLGPPFRYVIPGFDVLAVEMRQMRIKGYTTAEKSAHTTFSCVMIPPSIVVIPSGWRSKMLPLSRLAACVYRTVWVFYGAIVCILHRKKNSACV